MYDDDDAEMILRNIYDDVFEYTIYVKLIEMIPFAGASASAWIWFRDLYSEEQ